MTFNETNEFITLTSNVTGPSQSVISLSYFNWTISTIKNAKLDAIATKNKLMIESQIMSQ